MSDEEREEQQMLFNQQEIDHYMKNNSLQPQISAKLKDWCVYCKLRGKKSAQQEYTKDIEEVSKFNTLERFFRLHTAIRDPSSLQIDTKLMYFLEGCEPVWQKWLHSGCLLINVKFKDEKKTPIGGKILNTIWDFLLLSLMGNSLPCQRLKKGGVVVEKKGQEDIIGIILSRREKISLIELWFRSDKNAPFICRSVEKSIWNQLQFLNENERGGIQIRYKKHKDSFTSQSTMKGSYLIKTSLNDSF